MVVSIGKGRGCDINRCDADRFGRAGCFRAQPQENMKNLIVHTWIGQSCGALLVFSLCSRKDTAQIKVGDERLPHP